MKNFLRILLTPACWIRNNPTDMKWDAELNELMDNYPIDVFERHTIKINGTSIWTSNFPYAFGNEYPKSKIRNYFKDRKECLPSRKTCFRLKDKINEEFKGIIHD